MEGNRVRELLLEPCTILAIVPRIDSPVLVAGTAGLVSGSSSGLLYFQHSAAPCHSALNVDGECEAPQSGLSPALAKYDELPGLLLL